MSSTDTNKSAQVSPERNLNWRQGLTISLGVPVLILPSIATLPNYIGGCAIIIWMFSVFQGFMQNFAFGELASRYPNVPGIPGFAQVVFAGKGESGNKYGFGKFIGGFTAWSYWFTWNAVLAVFAMTCADYMTSMIPALAPFAGAKWLSVVVGVVIFGGLIFISYTGVTGGATVGYLLAALSLIPLFVISFAGLFSPEFSMENIKVDFIKSDWTWDLRGIFVLLGIGAVAQWSACGWEAAAIYAPLYKNPQKDIPKALFTCGIVCIFSYFIVQFVCTGVLGVKGITDHALAPMLELANRTMGSVGATIAIIMLIASMVLIIQTALLGSMSAMQSMADEGNLPKFLGKTNRHGVPIIAMVVTSALNVVYIIFGSTSAILAGAAVGYVIANGVGLFAYMKVASQGGGYNGKDIYRAPKGWKFVAAIFGFLNIPFYLVGIMIINFQDYGWQTSLIGMVVLLLYVPLWFWSKKRYQGT